MKEAKSRAQSKTGNRSPGGLRIVAINCNPAPDAKDRLRRLFTLLLEHTARDRQIATEEDSPANATSADARPEGED